jgi:hypothetical protein
MRARHARERATKDGEWVRAMLAQKPAKLVAVALADRTDAPQFGRVPLHRTTDQSTIKSGTPAPLTSLRVTKSFGSLVFSGLQESVAADFRLHDTRVSGEHPVDASAAVVALGLPCGDFGDELFTAIDAPVEALAAQDADLDLDHVQPACVLGV